MRNCKFVIRRAEARVAFMSFSDIRCNRVAEGDMVVLAQLAEHRIVVPSVVGSSPIIHPKGKTVLFYKD